MPSEPIDTLARDERLQDVVLAYLKAVDAGQAPDQQDLLARHPDLAADLRAFFSGQHKIQAGIAPLRGVLEQQSSPPFSKRLFGDYELLKEIAHGGMGIVYKARQISLKRIVALKMIRAGQLASPEDVRRFRTEAENAATLDHPNIVPIYEVGECEGQHYFTMKRIQGGSLAQHLGLFAHASRASARLVAKVARAVHHGHQRGILHRDLKPANILLDGRGQPHVTDFGLAKRVEGGTVMTQTGVIVGTPSYMAPEQAAGKKQLTTAVDVYGLGTILYELLTGRPPFWATTPLETLRKVLEQEPVPPRTVNPRLDRDLETICLKCLQKDPGKRYGSAEALAEDLEHWLAHEPIEGRRTGVAERAIKWARRNPVVAGLATLLILILVSATAISSFFAVQAERQARDARKNATLAKEEKIRADDKTVEAEAISKQATLEKERADRKSREAESNAQEITAEKEVVRRHLYATNLNLAQNAWTNAPITRMLELLNEERPKAGEDDLRGFEWYYLWRLCHSGLYTLTGHKADTCVAYSPDGKYVASGGYDPPIKIWDAVRGQELLSLEAKQIASPHIRSMAFSPKGSLFAASVGGRLHIWDTSTWTPTSYADAGAPRRRR